MTYLLLQTFLLLLASYFLGAFLACLVKRAVMGTRTAAPAHVPTPVQIAASARPPVVATSPPPVRPLPGPPIAPRIAPHIAPRPIDPVQPRIDVLRRPEPRPTPKLIDPTRFECALMGPEPNEGIPRKAIVEIRPAVLKSPTGPIRPRAPTAAPQPKTTPVPEPEKVTAPPLPPAKAEAPPSPAKSSDKDKPVSGTASISRLSDATTSAAAAAVAAAKAAAAALFAPSAPSKPVGTPTVPSEAPPAATKPPAPAETKPVETKPAETTPAGNTAPPVAKVPIEGGDDFQQIRAIDADLEQQLKGLGVIYFEHIAAWTSSDVKRIGQVLGVSGRIDREQWVEQAQILAKGGETYYSRNRLASQKTNLPPSDSVNSTPSGSNSSPAASAPASSPTVGATAPPTTSEPGANPAAPDGAAKATQLSGVAAASQGRSVAEMAAAAAAAIAAASASVTRGLKPIEPISPLSKVDPKISIPARLSDAIKEKETASASARSEKDRKPDKSEIKPSPVGEGPADDLKRIRGIGVLIEKRLNAIGVTRYEQIANWTSGDIDRVSQTLEFKGRIERESWVEQARILSSGGQTEFSRRVDRGEFDTSRET